MQWDRVKQWDRGTGRLDISQIGECACHRDVGITPVVKDTAAMLWICSGAAHPFLAREGRLVCASHQDWGAVIPGCGKL